MFNFTHTYDTLLSEDKQCRFRYIDAFNLDGSNASNIAIFNPPNAYLTDLPVTGKLIEPYHRTVQSFQLKLRVTFQGGAKHWITMGDPLNDIITINTFCGLKSAYIGPRQTDVHQRVDVNDTLLTKFTFHQTTMTTNLINCNLTHGVVGHSNLTPSTVYPLPEGDKYVVPLNITEERTYNFTFRVYDEGSNLYDVTPATKFVLEVGCKYVNLTWAYDELNPVIFSPVNYTGKGIWSVIPFTLLPWESAPGVVGTVADYPFCNVKEI